VTDDFSVDLYRPRFPPLDSLPAIVDDSLGCARPRLQPKRRPLSLRSPSRAPIGAIARDVQLRGRAYPLAPGDAANWGRSSGTECAHGSAGVRAAKCSRGRMGGAFDQAACKVAIAAATRRSARMVRAAATQEKARPHCRGLDLTSSSNLLHLQSWWVPSIQHAQQAPHKQRTSQDFYRGSNA
jgi:hypothetical protein